MSWSETKEPPSATGPFQDGGAGSHQEYVRSLVRPPVLSSEHRRWDNVLLHRFKVPSFETKLAGSRLHRITVQLDGQILINRSRDGGHDRQWSHRDCTNIVPAGVPSTRSFKGFSDFLAIYITPELVNEVAAEIFEIDAARVSLMESFAVRDESLVHIGHLLLEESQTAGEGTKLYADTLTRVLALHMLRAYSTRSQRVTAPPGPMVGWRLRRAMDYMRANLAEDIALSQLAAVAGLSTSQFARSFRASVGEAPHRYLMRLRLERARRLLEETHMPVIEVGLSCGFEHAAHFSTMFRKAIGLSPRAYRTARCT